MSDFGDISRMDLSKLDKKGYHPEDDDDIEDVEVVDGDGTGDYVEAEVVDASDDDSASDQGNIVHGGGQTGDEEDIAPDNVEVEDKPQKKHMAAPTGKHYYIDAHITEKEMIAFLFAHNYRSPLMLIATVVGIVWPLYTIIKAEGNVLFAVLCAGVFLIFMPASIYIRGRNGVRKNPIYENTFHYMVDEAGVHVELAEHAVDVDWKSVTKKLFLKTSAVIYTGKINAYLIPTAAMGDRKDEIIAFIKAH